MISRTKRLTAIAGVAATLLATMGTAGATPTAQEQPGSEIASRTSISVNAQMQEESNWCWAVTGLITSQALGKARGVSQNQFCNTARGNPNSSYRCANRTGLMSDVQRGARAFGVNPGRATGTVSFRTIQSNIDAGAPIPAGYYWSSGGGHMVAIIGYDASSQEIMIHDSLRGNRRLLWGRYTDFVRNRSWRWVQSITGMSAGYSAADSLSISSLNSVNELPELVEAAPEVAEVKAADTSVTSVDEGAVAAATDSVSAFFAEMKKDEVSTMGVNEVVETAVSSDLVEINTLNPAFVRGNSRVPFMADGVASLATSTAGDKAVVMFDTSNGKAEYVRAMSGDDEVRFANMADGGVVFKEPQINAYYRVADGKVFGLNEAAKEVVGSGVSVAAYQRIVSGKYASKMAGSYYQATGHFG